MNLRDAPVSGQFLTTLDHSQTVEQVDDLAPVGWLHVRCQMYDADLEGFVSARYVVADGSEPGSDRDDDPPLAVTEERLSRLTPSAKSEIIGGIAAAFGQLAGNYWVNASVLMLRHFLVRGAHEMASFRLCRSMEIRRTSRVTTDAEVSATSTREMAAISTPVGSSSCQAGNYSRLGVVIVVNLIDNPELAAQPENSPRIALEYWQARTMNALGDAADIKRVTRAINGGCNGLPQRVAFYDKARAIRG